MSNNNNQISVTYTDAELRNVIEEFITQRREGYTLKDVCSYILYWAVEDGKVADENGLIESNEISNTNQDEVKRILEAIGTDGRIAATPEGAYSKRC